MEAEPGPASREAKPRIRDRTAVKVVVIALSFVLQAGFVWRLVDDWSANSDARPGGSASMLVVAAVVVGIVVTELVLLLRRRGDPLNVAVMSTALINFTTLVASRLMP